MDTIQNQGATRIHWLNASFLFITPIFALIAVIWHSKNYGVGLSELAIFVFWYLACGMSITVGYHRLFTHRSHSAAWPLRLLYAGFGAGAFENSILEWSSDHRRHHKYVDEEEDPYSASRGFWWSHILWIFLDTNPNPTDLSNVKDLEKDWIVRIQHKYIFKIGFLVGAVLPALVGYLLGGIGGAIGGFIYGGLVRTVFVQHGTFLINSAAHIWGNQPYSKDNTSKDCFWLAFFTFGEGYHNYHHAFQADYRNGIRWWQFDPSKWWIRTTAFFGLSSNLKRTPKWKIETTKMDSTFGQAVEEWEVIRGESGLEMFRERAAASRVAVVKTFRDLEVKRSERKLARDDGRDEIARQMKEMKLRIREIRLEFGNMITEMMQQVAINPV